MDIRKRDVFIRLDNIAKIVETLTEIKTQEDTLKNLFKEYDSLNQEETKIFENWKTYYDDISQKLDHITL